MEGNVKPLKCIIHLGDDTKEDITCFNDTSWDKIKSCDERRRSLFSSSKYFSISLPNDYTEDMRYHMSCYRKFTAVKSSNDSHITDDICEVPLLRSNITRKIETTNTGIFSEKCLFCLGERKRKKGQFKYEMLGACLTEETGESIRKAAETMSDQEMLVKIAGIELKVKGVKYHHSCKRDYFHRAEGISKTKTANTPSESRSSHSVAFEEVKQYVLTNLVEREGAVLLTTIHKNYLKHLPESNYASTRF